MTTIGVAIAVPEPWGAALQRHRASFGDPLAAEIPPHVTLSPPTLVDDEQMKAVEEHLADVAATVRPFRLRLSGTATFRPVSPVVFVAVTEGISSCEVLAARVRSGPLTQQLTFPYHPHVTVAHDIDDAALDLAFARLAGFRCSFNVAEFSLYIHGEDGFWRPERAFPLTP